MMKMKLLLPVLLMLHVTVYAQQSNIHAYDTMPALPEHYAKRIQEFKHQKVATGGVVFLGNSITEGGAAHGLTNGKDKINRGISGDVTFGILNRIDDVIRLKPSSVFILIGINDLAKNIPDTVIVKNYKRIVHEIKRSVPSCKIFIQSILPVNPQARPSFPKHYNKNDGVVRVNEMLKDIADEGKAEFVDLYSVFADESGRLNASYTYDGLHLNEKGYEVWLESIKRNF